MARWQLKDKVVLITGGARGIGAAVAAELAQRGAVPVLADVDDDALAKTSAALGGASTASLASFAHAPAMSAYSASKAGVEAFANSLRTEVAHQGVRVGVLHPTWIDTDMVREGDESSATFQRLRESLRPPFAKTYPVESVVGPIADAFAKRRRKVFLPGFVRVAHIARPLLQTRMIERDQLKAAPDMRRLFIEQAEREGSRSAALGPRWRDTP